MLSKTETTQLEKIATKLYADADAACGYVADQIERLLREREAAGAKAVLGLATGATPVRLYRELIRRHREEGLSFKHVVTFNLDEYYGLEGTHPESYRRFMQEQLFDQVDIVRENTYVPDGTVARESVFKSVAAYEAKIVENGGIDIQILGIGRTGHIGFNEPGSGAETRTRLVTLDALTRRDAARDFLGEENVPRNAITMGVGTILDARKVYLLAWGESKAEVIAESVEGSPTSTLPASFLQLHKDCVFCLDYAAGKRLTRIRHPWLVGTVDWSAQMIRQATIWLARKTKKPLLKLVDEDYAENGMADLLTIKGSAYALNIDLFNITQHTITGWPGGKPNADDSCRPEREKPFQKRALVLSPEPLDDVFGMGGTLHRLVNQGHDVTVAYQTSGNLAVPDADVRRTTELMIELGGIAGKGEKSAFSYRVQEQLDEKDETGAGTADIRLLKGLIRRGEARSSATIIGVSPRNLRFLDLPFYEAGRYRRFASTEKDVEGMKALLMEIKPHQIFATGYLSDPLSVPAICFKLLRDAMDSLSEESWVKDCRIWLYCGAGSEWDMHEIEMAVPLSPDELENKLQGIYQHQSQRSQSAGLSRGNLSNAWNVASQLNQTTAQYYDELGLAEYEAMESFKRYELKGDGEHA